MARPCIQNDAFTASGTGWGEDFRLRKTTLASTGLKSNIAMPFDVVQRVPGVGWNREISGGRSAMSDSTNPYERYVVIKWTSNLDSPPPML